MRIKVSVFAFDERAGRRSFTAKNGTPMEFFSQQVQVDNGPGHPVGVLRLDHRARSEVLAPGDYEVDVVIQPDRFGNGTVLFTGWKALAGAGLRAAG